MAATSHFPLGELSNKQVQQSMGGEEYPKDSSVLKIVRRSNP